MFLFCPFGLVGCAPDRLERLNVCSGLLRFDELHLGLKTSFENPACGHKKMMVCDEFKFLKKHQANQFGTSVRL
ncbi:hypothetical protein OAN307_c03860 [Octadecabacter antarcticus 307]|uniref:Putative CHCC zinc finger domain-containing protein n=1 Tax=Octadecabacter antarcticus 307 TaxID=391626 RepID=M9R1L3_9RHOB|nr:hypothetical protein OAN307_c03860 [Octadecabacter antarcticus 307]